MGELLIHKVELSNVYLNECVQTTQVSTFVQCGWWKNRNKNMENRLVLWSDIDVELQYNTYIMYTVTLAGTNVYCSW